MPSLRDFTALSIEERDAIVEKRESVSLRVSKGVLKIANLPKGGAFSRAGYCEIPPTPIALQPKPAAEIYVHAPPGPAGDRQRLFILTYRQGGKIYFRNLDDEAVEARFIFDD